MATTPAARRLAQLRQQLRGADAPALTASASAAGQLTALSGQGHHLTELVGPASNYYISQRLKLHYADWGNEHLPLLVLVHGGRDHCRSWDEYAQQLRTRYHVVAPDLRGHGDSQWAFGGEYQVQEFVLDLAQLLRMLNKFPVILVGHSLGAVVALQYTGLFPQNIHRLVAIEGLGGPPALVREWLAAPYWSRMLDWIDQVQDLAGRKTKRYDSIEKASERMRAENPFLSPDQAHHLTVHGVLRNEDGTYSWKFDNYMRPIFPSMSSHVEGVLDATFARITCPTLFLAGSTSWHGDPTTDGRLKPFTCRHRAILFQDAGHWLHHDKPEAFMTALTDFLRDADAGRL